MKFPAVLNFVIQLKDEKSATEGFEKISFFDYSEPTVDQFTSIQAPGAAEGATTGLGANSGVFGAAGHHVFFAVWQRNAFVVILIAVGLDFAACQKIATTQDKRIG